MEHKDIIKALECCASEEYICTQCPIDEKIKDDCECGKVVARNALALIKELTEENERLRAIPKQMKERFIAEIEQTPNANEHFIKAWKSKIDQIAKDMSEGV